MTSAELPKGFDGPGHYSICPLCDEHIKLPEVPPAPPGIFWEPASMMLALNELHEATLRDHLLGHTAEVVLSR